MNVQALYDIRDARGICAEEKAILLAVATRGEAWGGWQTIAGDAGLSKDRFYKYRSTLQEKAVLTVTERPGATTLYRVNGEALATFVPDPSGKPGNPLLPEEADPSGKPGSPFLENPETPLPENPEGKETSKGTSQGDHSSLAPDAKSVKDMSEAERKADIQRLMNERKSA